MGAMLESVLLILGAYLLASVPSAYLVARYLKDIDIRRYGSGNAGATNVMVHVGTISGFTLGTFDCLVKGTLPVVIGRALDVPLGVPVTAGLVAVVAHNWSPFMRFTGGRGVATAIGLVVGFFLLQEMLIMAVVIGVIGKLVYKDTGLWTFVAMIALPILTYVFDRPLEIVAMSVCIGIILMAKRLTANWERPEDDVSLVAVLPRRLIWDRDVPRRSPWTERSPSG
jgi:glycerol-3-phosphate acyltransferase PlsY